MPSLSDDQLARSRIIHSRIKETKLGPFDHQLNPNNKPIVTSFAWDSMSYLGNEWWVGLTTKAVTPLWHVLLVSHTWVILKLIQGHTKQNYRVKDLS